jgi:hypothetical protein
MPGSALTPPIIRVDCRHKPQFRTKSSIIYTSAIDQHASLQGMPKNMPTPRIAALFRLAQCSGEVIENAHS